MPWSPAGTVLGASAAACRIVISSVMVFLLFAPLLAGHPRASGACSLGQGVLFAGEPRELRSIVLFLGGTANPEGPAQRESRSPPCRQARRRLSHLAVPARSGRKRRRTERIEANGQEKDWGPRCDEGAKGFRLKLWSPTRRHPMT